MCASKSVARFAGQAAMTFVHRWPFRFRLQASDARERGTAAYDQCAHSASRPRTLHWLLGMCISYTWHVIRSPHDAAVASIVWGVHAIVGVRVVRLAGRLFGTADWASLLPTSHSDSSQRPSQVHSAANNHTTKWTSAHRNSCTSTTRRDPLPGHCTALPCAAG